MLAAVVAEEVAAEPEAVELVGDEGGRGGGEAGDGADGEGDEGNSTRSLFLEREVFVLRRFSRRKLATAPASVQALDLLASGVGCAPAVRRLRRSSTGSS